MKKFYLFFVGSIFWSTHCICQNDKWMVDQISEEICTVLNSYENIGQLSNEQVNEIFFGTIKQYKNTWDKQLQDFPNSGNEKVRASYYHQIINHRLLWSCEKFHVVDDRIDRNFTDNELLRKLYVLTKKFLSAAEALVDIEILLSYFDPSIDRTELTDDLNKLLIELNSHKLSSTTYIMNPTGSLDFYINIHDFKTGDEKLAIIIYFDDKSDVLIDNWTFKTKKEMEEEKIEEEIDFGNIPPPPVNEEINNR